MNNLNLYKMRDIPTKTAAVVVPKHNERTVPEECISALLADTVVDLEREVSGIFLAGLCFAVQKLRGHASLQQYSPCNPFGQGSPTVGHSSCGLAGFTAVQPTWLAAGHFNKNCQY